MVTLAAIQLSSTDDVQVNLNKIESFAQRARQKCKGELVIVLPECAVLFGVSGKQMLNSAETLGVGSIQDALSAIASQASAYIVAGTIPILTKQKDKFFACSMLVDPDGNRIAHYNKMHLFDVDVNDNTKSYRESKYTEPGEQTQVVNLSFATLGIAVCYDLRFPVLFHKMNMPSMIALPSAFTKVTGKAHWHTLVRARAIENQSYVIAANQWGTHADGRETYGNSCIYGPDGELLAIKEEGEGIIFASFDPEKLKSVRKNMPIEQHRLENYE